MNATEKKKPNNLQILCRATQGRINSVTSKRGNTFSLGQVWFLRARDTKVKVAAILTPIDGREGEFRIQLKHTVTEETLGNLDIEHAMDYLSHIN